MKIAILSLVIATALALPAAAQKKGTAKGKPPAPKSTTETASTSLAIGSPIPAENEPFRDTKGQTATLAQSKTSKGLLVMFSCNTCPFVIKAQKRTDEAMRLATAKGIGMVIFNSNEGQRNEADSEPAMIRYADEQHYNVPYIKDDMSAMANHFGATRTPEVFLFDANGKLVYKGALEDNPADPQSSTKMYLRDALTALAEGKPQPVKETKSIGCSIKRLN